eukprot:gene1347-784_t
MLYVLSIPGTTANEGEREITKNVRKKNPQHVYSQVLCRGFKGMGWADETAATTQLTKVRQRRKQAQIEIKKEKRERAVDEVEMPSAPASWVNEALFRPPRELIKGEKHQEHNARNTPLTPLSASPAYEWHLPIHSFSVPPEVNFNRLINRFIFLFLFLFLLFFFLFFFFSLRFVSVSGSPQLPPQSTTATTNCVRVIVSQRKGTKGLSQQKHIIVISCSGAQQSSAPPLCTPQASVSQGRIPQKTQYKMFSLSICLFFFFFFFHLFRFYFSFSLRSALEEYKETHGK